MSRHLDRLTWLQRHPAVRLRREAWGGFAFHRDTGDLLELDRDGFDVVLLMGTAHTFVDLCSLLRARGHRGARPRLASFLAKLETHAMIGRVPADSSSLPPDPWADDSAITIDGGLGLRAPVVAHWAVTYRCNLSCTFCYAESGPGRDPEPHPRTRCRIVERLAAWGVLEVALGGGEPTLLPDFPELLAAIRAGGMVPNVTTNGTIHRSEIVGALAEHAGVVHLSADRPDRLDAARGPGVFTRLRETARDLAGAGVRLGVNLLLTPDNARDLLRSLENALDLGAQIHHSATAERGMGKDPLAGLSLRRRFAGRGGERSRVRGEPPSRSVVRRYGAAGRVGRAGALCRSRARCGRLRRRPASHRSHAGRRCVPLLARSACRLPHGQPLDR